MPSPILSIRGLTRRFGDFEAVARLDLDVAPGERVALLGANGSGKSTVLRCVAGSLAPSEGTVTVGGHPGGSAAARRLTGVSLSQERSFYLRLSGRENLEFFAAARVGRRANAVRAARAVEAELELEEIAAKRVDRCSTGMVQQLAVARALLADPALILLDEPTRSLDRAAVARMWGAVDRRPAAALLIATHRDEDVQRCGRSVELG